MPMRFFGLSWLFICFSCNSRDVSLSGTLNEHVNQRLFAAECDSPARPTTCQYPGLLNFRQNLVLALLSRHPVLDHHPDQSVIARFFKVKFALRSQLGWDCLLQ